MENNIQKLHYLISTASAAYADISSNTNLENDLTKADGGAGHTEKQAEQFAENLKKCWTLLEYSLIQRKK